MTLRNRFLTTAAALSLSATVLGGVFVATAQAAPAEGRQEKRAAGKADTLKRFDELNLTAEQKDKIKSIYEAHRARLKALTPEQRQEQRKEMNKSLQEEIAAVLTPEQRQKLQEGQKGGAKGGGPTAKLLDDLNLTAEQKEKVAPILEDSRAEAKKIQEDQSLQPKERGEKMRTLMQETLGRIKPILTAEQQTKLEASIEKNREEARKRAAEKKAGAKAN